MRFDWLVPTGLGVTSALVLTLPAEAAQLQSWWFDARENQLIFTTDATVQPRARMIFNPTRIVIDLPGTTLGRPPISQRVGGAIREVRSGQFDSQTARLVIEFDEGYTVNPQDVEVRGIRGNRWIVQLPELEVSESPASDNIPPNTGNSVTGDFSNDATTFLANVTATPDGFFVRTSGQIPTINLERRGDRGEERQLIIDLFNTSISPFLDAETLPLNRYSVSRWDIVQDPDSTTARIVMTLAPGSPDWEVTPTNIGNQKGLVIIPPSGVSISSVPDNPQRADPSINVPPSQTPSIPQPSQPPITPPIVNNGRILVAIDPGHGGRDPGAVGIGGLQEKNVVFPVSLRVAELLREAGVDVIMTRTSDRTLDLEPRVDIANNANATIFLSIHANAISLSRPDVNGVETYYYSESGRQLANIIHANVLPASGLGNRGVKQARFFVLRHTAMPAALLELGFVTGAEDVAKLRDPVWQERMAQAITRGLLQYLEPYRR